MHSLALTSPTPPFAVFPAHCSLRRPHYVNAWNRLRSRVEMGGFVSNCIMAGALGTLRLLLLDITRVNFVPQNSPIVQFDTTSAISEWPIYIVCKLNSSLLVASLIPDPVTRYQSKTNS